MSYRQPVAINCTVMGAPLARFAGTAMPQMPGRDVVGDCQRRHCAALSLRSSQVHPAQNRRHHDLYRRGQAIRGGSTSTWHQNLSMLLGHWSKVSQGHHDGGSRSLYSIGQQRNRRPLGRSTSPWAYSAGLRKKRHCGGLRMAAHHRCRGLLSHSVTLPVFNPADVTAPNTRNGEFYVET